MKNAIERVVYILIYPAILASMLYEFFDLIGTGDLHFTVMLALVLIALVYLLDFATNEGAINDLGQGKNSNLGMTVDVIAAILFRAAFQLTIEEYFASSLACLISAAVLFFLYNALKRNDFVLQIWLTVVLMVLVWVTQTFQVFTIWHLLVGESLMIIAYIFYTRVTLNNPAQ